MQPESCKGGPIVATVGAKFAVKYNMKKEDEDLKKIILGKS
jgi:hypothetical protein